MTDKWKLRLENLGVAIFVGMMVMLVWLVVTVGLDWVDGL